MAVVIGLGCIVMSFGAREIAYGMAPGYNPRAVNKATRVVLFVGGLVFIIYGLSA
jgi:hypothetical protein